MGFIKIVHQRKAGMPMRRYIQHLTDAGNIYEKSMAEASQLLTGLESVPPEGIFCQEARFKVRGKEMMLNFDAPLNVLKSDLSPSDMIKEIDRRVKKVKRETSNSGSASIELPGRGKYDSGTVTVRVHANKTCPSIEVLFDGECIEKSNDLDNSISRILIGEEVWGYGTPSLNHKSIVCWIPEGWSCFAGPFELKQRIWALEWSLDRARRGNLDKLFEFCGQNVSAASEFKGIAKVVHIDKWAEMLGIYDEYELTEHSSSEVLDYQRYVLGRVPSIESLASSVKAAGY